MEANTDKSLRAALVAAQAEFTPVAKDRENPYFKSEYATLLAVVGMVRPILAKHGIGYAQDFTDDNSAIVTRVFNGTEEMAFRCPFSCADTKPQGYGSAITYFRRYALQTALGIVVCDGTDDDGNAAQGLKDDHKPKQIVQPSRDAPRAKTPPTVCPLSDPRFKGKHWNEIDADALRNFLKLPVDKFPALTADHRNAIIAEIGKREKAETVKDI